MLSPGVSVGMADLAGMEDSPGTEYSLEATLGTVFVVAVFSDTLVTGDIFMVPPPAGRGTPITANGFGPVTRKEPPPQLVGAL
jgi:hypothetical protein